MRKKEDLIFIGLFTAVILLVFRQVVVLKIGFLKGDYLQQFLPWYKIYADSIQRFELPLWSSSFQSGFPLFAEGQIGALYPLNLLFFFTLPFKIAYNYSFLVHFILAGIFTYFYCRKIGSDFWGGFIASILLCFGSAYAGLFVNTSALRSLTWFPLVLLFFEKYFERRNKGLIALAGLIAGMQLLAGSFQMTSYAFIFYIAYFLYRSFLEKRRFWGSLIEGSTFFIIAVLISLPQLISTLQLSAYSNRSPGNPGFALWNSFSPLSLIGGFLPSIGSLFSRGDIIYIGILGLFFAFISIYLLKQDKMVKGLVLLLMLSLFLALGKYNPLYVILLKLFKFYAFRSPSRFIYFAVFALAVLGGRGFTCFFNSKWPLPQIILKWFGRILFAALGVFLCAKLSLWLWGEKILSIAKDYAARHIYAAAHHRYSLEAYLVKTGNFYNRMLERFSFSGPEIIFGLSFLAAAGMFIRLAGKARLRKNTLKYLCLVFICAELFVFSFFSKGLRGEFDRFSCLVPKETKIFSILREDKGLFRVLPFGKVSAMSFWLKPNMNAYFGLDSAAFYSPLANREYFLKTKGLGIVDDSLGVIPPLKNNLYIYLELIRRLNVKYIVSATELDPVRFNLLADENGLYLYSLKEPLPRIFLEGGDLRIKEYTPGAVEVEVDTESGGELVYSESYYPGWTAYLDGKKIKIDKFMDIIQSVRIPPGRHTVIFEYQLGYLKFLLLLQSMVLFGALFYGVYQFKTKNGQENRLWR